MYLLKDCTGRIFISMLEEHLFGDFFPALGSISRSSRVGNADIELRNTLLMHFYCPYYRKEMRGFSTKFSLTMWRSSCQLCIPQLWERLAKSMVTYSGVHMVSTSAWRTGKTTSFENIMYLESNQPWYTMYCPTFLSGLDLPWFISCKLNCV